MKGLFIKDLLLIRSVMKRIWLFFLLLFAAGLVTGNPTFLITCVFALCITSVNVTFNCDEASKWESFALSAPISRRELIGEKYLLCLAVTGGMAVLGLLAAAAGLVFPIKIESGALAGVLALTLGGTLLMLSVFIPLLIRFGSERGRIVLVVCMMVGLSAIYILQSLGHPAVPGWARTWARCAAWCAPASVALALYLSYRISRKFAEKKEY